MLKTRPYIPYLYCLPAVALLALVFGYPMIRVVDFSTRLIRGSSGPFIGLDNFRNTLDDPTFRDAWTHSLTLLIAVPAMLAISLLVSVLLYEQVRGWRIFRTVLFAPYVLAVPVAAIIASYLFQLHGAVNELLAAIGLDRLAIDWIGSEDYALMTVLIVIVWREVGFGIVLFLARLMSQDTDPLEAATIDGASWLQRLRHVVIPELRPTIEFYVVVSAITMLSSVFGYVYALTHGGPGTSTMVLELYIYNLGEVESAPGMASAVATILLGATTVLILLLFWVRRRATRRDLAESL